MLRSLSAVLLLCNAIGFPMALQASTLVPPKLPTNQAEAYSRIASRVIAPCCWSQPVISHQSEAAEKVRSEILAYLKRGDSEEKILDLLAKEYGERILGEPRGTAGMVAYVTPYAVLAVALSALIFALAGIDRRRRRHSFEDIYSGLLPDLPEADL